MVWISSPVVEYVLQNLPLPPPPARPFKINQIVDFTKGIWGEMQAQMWLGFELCCIYVDESAICSSLHKLVVWCGVVCCAAKERRPVTRLFWCLRRWNRVRSARAGAQTAAAVVSKPVTKPRGRDALEGGEPPSPPLQGAQPMPSHCLPDAKCQPQCAVLCCAEGAVSTRQWPGWSCARENASREGRVAERVPCVVCCAPVTERPGPLVGGCLGDALPFRLLVQ